MAGARHERRLLAVACPGRVGGYPTNPPTEPYVKISLIRFLGTARFHTAKLPDSQTTRVIRLRPHSSTSSPGCPMLLGSHLALDPAFHDPGPGQRIRRPHPTQRSPRPLPTAPAIQPIPPRARRRVVHQIQALAVTPDAVVLVVATQLCTQ